MRIVIRLVLAAALLALGVWVWSVWFPSPESVIRKHIAEVAKAASFRPNESMLAKGLNVQKLASCFSLDVEIRIEPLGRGPFTLSGRDEISQAAMAARSQLDSLTVTFLDINVTVGADKQSAVAGLTAKAAVPRQKDFEVMELKLTLKKVDGEWLITRVETVKTLSGAAPDGVLVASGHG